MQTASLTNLEVELERIYVRQVAVYTRILELTRYLAEEHATFPADHTFGLINEEMAEIARLDAMVGPLRDQWKSLGGRPSGALAAALQEVEQLIVELMKRIDRAEQIAVEAKAKLMPKMSAESRRRQMTAAYQAGRQSS